jgi:hypothetical protein
MPADSSTHYNETPDTQSCRFKCYSMYSWDGGSCSSDGYCGDEVVHNDHVLYSGNSAIHLPLDEGEGAVATDISGQNNNGSIIGTPAWVNGRFGKAVSYDGTDDRINWGYSGTRPENNFTMMAWVKTSTAITIHPEANTDANAVTGQRYVFYPDHGGEGCPWAGAGLSVGTNGIIVAEHCAAYAPPIAVYSGNIGSGWNHIAVTYTNKQPRIYLNGKLVRTGLISTQPAVRSPLSSGNGWNFFAGTVDDIRIFDRPLSNSEIRGFVTGPVMALSMDESTGGIAFDSSGNGNNGTIYGSSRVAGHLGSAIQFDSVSDYITLPASNSIVSDESGITVSLWAKADPVQASSPRITSLFRGAGLTGFNIGINDGEWASYSGTSEGGTWLKSGIAIDSAWHHIIATNDGTTHRIYVDGIERNSRAQSFSVGATAAVIGRVNADANLAFKGIVDEVRIYNRAISASEVLSENLEFCDGTSGVMACSSVNPFFNSGDVTCTGDCGFNFSGCGYCGDGIVSGPEECDGAAGLMSCNAYDPSFYSGMLSCNDTCGYDFSNCVQCPAGWEHMAVGGGTPRCIRVFNEIVNGTTAHDRCYNNYTNGRLVTITNSDENNFIRNLLGGNSHWIGLMRRWGRAVDPNVNNNASTPLWFGNYGGVATGNTGNSPSGNRFHFFKFTTKEAATYSFYLWGLSADLDLYLYQSNCSTFITSSAAAGNADESFRRSLSASTTYCVRVGYNHHSSPYSLAVNYSGTTSTRYHALDWVWNGIDMPLYNYHNWNSGEPNDSGSATFSESCTEMINTGYWNDADCSGTRRYVCEIPH